MLLRAMRGHRYKATYLLALLLRLRSGEIFRLTWDTIDLEAGTLRVARQL